MIMADWSRIQIDRFHVTSRAATLIYQLNCQEVEFHFQGNNSFFIKSVW